MRFEPGAPAPEGSIPLCVPEIRGNEWEYIKECLDTNWVSSVGSFVDRFEQSIADFVGVDHAVATVNGTSALHTALLIAGVEPDDEVLVSTLTFVAPAAAIRYAGAWPVFMDAEPIHWQMDPDKVREFLETACVWRDGQLFNKTTGRRVKAVLPVHILGHPCDMNPIVEVARRFDLALIEDAAESLGSKYRGANTGSMGDVSCFSFNGNKLITSGGGGMVVTDKQEWADRARYLTTQAKDDPIEYVHNEIGYNYRLSNIQAAMGVAQMEQIESYIEKKRAIARAYENGLGDHSEITLMAEREGTESAYWLNTVLLGPDITLDERMQVVSDLIDDGIGVRPLWHPIHSLPPYADCQAFRIEHADDLYRRGVSLPSSVGLEAEEQQRCIAALVKRLAG